MNTKETQKSERIASRILRALAILGLVAVLALLAWVIVQGIRLAPRGGEALSAAVSTLTSLVREAPEEAVMFELESRSFAHGQAVTLAWDYTGEPTEGQVYTLSYNCNRDAQLSVLQNDAWNTLSCEEEITTMETSLSVIPTASEARFTDVELSIATGGVEDMTLVTIVYTGTPTTASQSEQQLVEEDATVTTAVDDTAGENTSAVESVPVPTPAVVTPAPTVPVVLEYRAPADLVMNIVDTGVYIDVAGHDTFFVIDPIPTDKRAGVLFTVTNRGDIPSGPWTFVANLPIEGAPAYEYISPVQDPVAPGMEVEFTLGFDEVLTGKGAITIEVVPTDVLDRPNNNVDAVSVEFEE